MKRDKISRRQIMIMLFIGLFSSIVRVLPRMGAQEAGNAAWLAPIVAFLPTLLYIWLMLWLLDDRDEEEGLAETYIACFGKVGGRILCLAFFLWLGFYGAYIIRNSAERLIVTAYPDNGLLSFAVVITLLCALTAMGKLRTLGRSAEVFFAAVMGILVLVIAFALARVKTENLLPVSKLDTVPVLRAGGLVADVGATAVSGFFLRGNVRRKSPGYQIVLRWLCLNTVIVALLLAVTIGTYGAALTWRMQQPFFAVVRDMSIFDVFERIEAVVMAIWVITDFMLITLHLFYCSEILRVCTGAKERKWFVPPTAAAALVVSVMMAKNAFDLWHITEGLVRLVVPVVSFVILPLSLVGIKIISKKQKKMKKVLDKGG